MLGVITEKRASNVGLDYRKIILPSPGTMYFFVPPVVGPDVLHSVRLLMCTATSMKPHKCFFGFNIQSRKGLSFPRWLIENEIVMLGTFVRNSKPEMATNLECRSRLRQESAFFFVTRSGAGVKILWKNESGSGTTFYFRKERAWFLYTSLLKYKHCWISVGSIVAGVWTGVGFSNFGPGSWFKNFGIGAESKPEHVTPAPLQ